MSIFLLMSEHFSRHLPIRDTTLKTDACALKFFPVNHSGQQSQGFNFCNYRKISSFNIKCFTFIGVTSSAELRTYLGDTNPIKAIFSIYRVETRG